VVDPRRSTRADFLSELAARGVLHSGFCCEQEVLAIAVVHENGSEAGQPGAGATHTGATHTQDLESRRGEAGGGGRQPGAGATNTGATHTQDSESRRGAARGRGRLRPGVYLLDTVEGQAVDFVI